MAWIESHDDLWEHDKFYKFVDGLVSIISFDWKRPDLENYAVGALHRLWHFVLRNAWRDANMESWGDAGIERAMAWQGTPGDLVKLMREVGFLNGFIVCGWMKRAGRLVHDRLENERRKVEKTGRLSSVNLPVTGRKPEATLPNLTLPNLTVPDQKPLAPAGPPSPRQEAVLQALKACTRVRVPEAESLVLAWDRAYPDVNLAKEVKKCEAWAVTKKVTRSPKGWARTLNSWLSKEQDKPQAPQGAVGRVVGHAAPAPGKYLRLGEK